MRAFAHLRSRLLSCQVRNQDPQLAIAVLPALTQHYPELLGTVYVAPINSLFYAVWSVVRIFHT